MHSESTKKYTRSSAAAHGGAASRGSTQGNAVEVHRSLPGRSRSPPKVHLMAATGVYFRYYTTRTHPAGGRVRSIRGAGWSRSAFVMTRSDFQKKSSSRPIPNLAWNTARKVYPWTGDFEDLGTDPSFGRNALAARQKSKSKSVIFIKIMC